MDSPYDRLVKAARKMVTAWEDLELPPKVPSSAVRFCRADNAAGRLAAAIAELPPEPAEKSLPDAPGLWIGRIADDLVYAARVDRCPDGKLRFWNSDGGPHVPLRASGCRTWVGPIALPWKAPHG